MPDEQFQGSVEEGPFADEEWIAAHARQMMRANRAKDAKAVELEFLHFQHYLTKSLLWRHLKKVDTAWDGAGRWFDGLCAEPAFPSPGRLRLQGEAAWVIGQERWHYDPLYFDLELCPISGSFRRYILRFGDHRPLAAKVSQSANAGVPVGGWAFEFERRHAEPAAAADRGRR